MAQLFAAAMKWEKQCAVLGWAHPTKSMTGASLDGRPAYEGILLFKITLLQTWFNLSDQAVEERINDSIKLTGQQHYYEKFELKGILFRSEQK